MAAAEKTLADSKAALVAVQAEVAKIEEEVAQIRAQIGALARVIYTTGGQFEEIQVLLDSKNPAEFTERPLRCEGSRVAIATLSNNSRLRRSRCRRS